MAKEKNKKGKYKPKFKLESENLSRRRQLLDCFSRILQASLESSEKIGLGQKKGVPKSALSRHSIMAQVSETLDIESKLDSRQFDTFLKSLYKAGYLRFRYRLLPERSIEMKQKKREFDDLQDITVVAGSDRKRFAEAAAENFIRRMFEIGKTKRKSSNDSGDWLNIGIVSGGTTGDVISAVMELNWKDDLGLLAAKLPNVRCLALNVCLMVPQYLSGNATILAHQLAEKIKNEIEASRSKEASDDRNGLKVEAYGLSAPLMVKREDLEKYDREPQTFDVIQFTEPYRVRVKLQESEKREKQCEHNYTELDIVLTGVGEVPPTTKNQHSEQDLNKSQSGPEGSIFYSLAKQFGFDMDSIISKEHIVGDIAFTAIRADGEPVTLCRHDRESKGVSGASEEEIEYVFYSAVQLPVLEAMALDRDKSVILVARYKEGKYKVPAIFASIAGEKGPYVSRLIIDEMTAQKLVHY